MNKIFARSPYIIEVDESSVVGSKLELFYYYSGTSVPTNPQYTIQKLIPASNNLKMYYDVSPYTREYLKFTTRQTAIGSGVSTGVAANNYNQMVKLDVKRYKETTSGNYTLLDTTTYYCMDGYGYYSEGANPQLTSLEFTTDQTASLPQGTYYYHYQSTHTPASTESQRAGLMGFLGAGVLVDLKYTNLVSGATQVITNPFASTDLYDVPTVWYDYYADGNKLEVWDNLGAGSPTLYGTWYFRPKCEIKYTPILVDFVNQMGYWQREWFYKASKNNINTKESVYNLMQSNSLSYSTLEGQRQEFNHNGQETITCNTGIVAPSYSETIQQIMLSEKVLVDSLPVTVDTKSIEKLKGVNAQGNINYNITFKYGFDMINSVI